MIKRVHGGILGIMIFLRELDTRILGYASRIVDCLSIVVVHIKGF